MPRPPSSPRASASRNTRTLLVLVGAVAAMTGLAFASVPLYRVFCQATGFEGTTQRASQAPGAVGGKLYTVRFNADVSPDLPWRFEPLQPYVRVHPGEQTLVAFRATNKSDHPITGTATFNVTPLTVGAYFDKIECFCFTEQTLGPGETADLPVTFFVSPEILKDKNTRDIDAITLSYTFFQAKNPTKPTAENRAGGSQSAPVQVGAVAPAAAPSSPRPAKESSR
ncbi:cytochrome c oxidase assembly protein CtaG [Aliidongia dinghuensis]|uniref:Cytochrome c oxidase assembly protein CtaG n=1 Tax=Aliidongia dinghuensis TaxID=1867774 RepID=A0A8J3E4Q7_9PROT|nr:cytochrome c oxidase assembly protein [Aliidongia dinghuensis]GGF16331.1 cytochrome c oxidase assembly protein CtaG [Aliidongia dinghuensis]